jgi:hypothetical protein
MLMKLSKRKLSQNTPFDILAYRQHRLTKNGSFSVFYFIGEIGASQPSEWLKLPSFAGLNHNFAAPVQACDNCGVHADGAHLVTDTTPITSTLLDYVEMLVLESMRPEHVRPFLIKNLKWRVVTVSTLIAMFWLMLIAWCRPRGRSSTLDCWEALRCPLAARLRPFQGSRAISPTRSIQTSRLPLLAMLLRLCLVHSGWVSVWRLNTNGTTGAIGAYMLGKRSLIT